jgi:hypothetical protein
MNDAMNSWSVQVAGMVLIAAAATAVFWAVDGLEAAWPFALIMAAFIGVVHFGRRRSNVLEVMSGSGDERVRSLYMRAVAFAGAVMAWLAARLVARNRCPGRPQRHAQRALRRVRALLHRRRHLARPTELVRSEHAVARELEVRRARTAARPVDPAVARSLHDEGVLGAAALLRLVHPQAA